MNGWASPGAALGRARDVLHGVGSDVGKVLLGVALAFAAVGPGMDLPFGAPDAAGVTAPTFVPQALGVVARETALFDHPARGERIVTLKPGTTVTVAGRVLVTAGWRTEPVYWASVEQADMRSYGFVPGGAIVLSTGAAPDLSLGGVPAADLLHPLEAAAAPGSAEADATGPASPGAPRAPVGAASSGGGIGGAGAVAAGAPGGSASASPVVGSAVSAAAISPPSAATRVEIAWLPETVTRWSALLEQAAVTHGVDPNLLAILVLVESGGNPMAVSPSGASGLMQVMPMTALDIVGRRGIAGHDASKLFDPAYCIDLGAWYIAEMLGQFGSADDPDWQRSVELAAAAYNGGPGTVQRFLSGAGALPAEAARYRSWVGRMWSERHQPTSTGFETWMAAGGARLVEAAAARPIG